jgi:hypothetical protein
MVYSAKIVMKTLILTLTFTASAANASIGSGFFPVVVLVMQADGVTPAKGVSVRLADLPEYRKMELDPDKELKVLAASLGKPVQTDEKGCAVVFFQGRFVYTPGQDKAAYGQQLLGTVVVEKEKQELFRVTLKEWAEKEKYSSTGNDAPFIIVVLGSE